MMRVAIIGGGLAGCAAAYALKQAGAEPVIYEAGAQLAGKASGNLIGLVNPRFAAFRTSESDYFVSAFSAAVRAFEAFEDIGWHGCGSLHLITDEKKARRFPQTIQNWGWSESEMRMVNAGEASEIAGLELTHDALYIRSAGFVSPRALCDFYTRDVTINLNAQVSSLHDFEEDAVIVASGISLGDFDDTKDLPFQTVRGQVTQVAANEMSKKLRCNLCYGGYFAPAQDDAHMLGATFQRWLDHDEMIPADDADNIEKLAAIAPDLAAGLKVIGGRAALRASGKDHVPMVGALGEGKRLYISAGHGSHGIISSFAAAQLLVDMILDRPRSQSLPTIHILSPKRFEQ